VQSLGMQLPRCVRLLCPLTCFAFPSCETNRIELPGPDGPVAAVGITLGFPGYVSDAFLTVGDQDTVRAQAYTGGWPSHTKYDSDSDPRRFNYTSSNPSVASVSLEGVVHAVAPGSTILRVTIDGVSSPPLQLAVEPPASSLVAEPDSITTVVGQTVSISINASDANSQPVTGVIFNVGLDTTYWAVTTVPAEGTWKLKTPAVLHLTARLAGRVRVIATVQNERASARLAASVPIRVSAP